MSQYQQAQAGWEWVSQEDERRWELEQEALIETRQTSPTKSQQTSDRMLADFDGIFMTDKENT